MKDLKLVLSLGLPVKLSAEQAGELCNTVIDLEAQLAKANEAASFYKEQYENVDRECTKLSMREAKANERADKEIERLAQINAELIIKNHELKRDKERLDLLDECNAEFNSRCGSNYGWKVDWNHNRIALVDTGIPKTDVRTAIDKFKARLSMDNRNKENESESESELDLVLDKYPEWPAKVSGSVIAYNGSNFMHCIESRLCFFIGYKRVCNEVEYNKAKQLRKEQE